MSWQLWAVDAWLRLSEKPRLARERSVGAERARMEATAARAFPLPAGLWREVRLRADPPLVALRLPAPHPPGA